MRRMMSSDVDQGPGHETRRRQGNRINHQGPLGLRDHLPGVDS